MKSVMILSALVALFLLTSVTLAQGGFNGSWWTVDGGGGASSGGGYTLIGASGQADAGGMSGGNYTLIGGFWSGSGLAGGGDQFVYLPIILRNQ